MSQGFAPCVENGFAGTGIPALMSDDAIDEPSPLARVNGDDAHRTDQNTETQKEPVGGRASVPVDRTGRRRQRFWWSLTLGALAVVGGIVVAGHLIGSGHGDASRLPSGGFLQPGQLLASPNGRFTLTMQTDGNLVEAAANRKAPIWATATSGNFGAYVVMQSDGDLVVYPRGRSAPAPGQPTPALWSSGTFGHRDSYLELSNGGNLMVVTPGRERAAWEVSGHQP
jgi:hypothetical protein